MLALLTTLDKLCINISSKLHHLKLSKLRFQITHVGKNTETVLYADPSFLMVLSMQIILCDNVCSRALKRF